MNGITTTLTVAGTGLVLWMWFLNQIQRVNPMSLFYIGCMAGGYILLVIAMFTADADAFAFNNWPFQIIMLFVSVWLTKLFFGRNR